MGLKTTFSAPNAPNQPDCPYIGVHHNTGRVVLFTCSGQGFVLYAGSGGPIDVGARIGDWDKSPYYPLSGSITLSND